MKTKLPLLALLTVGLTPSLVLVACSSSDSPSSTASGSTTGSGGASTSSATSTASATGTGGSPGTTGTGGAAATGTGGAATTGTGGAATTGTGGAATTGVGGAATTGAGGAGGMTSSSASSSASSSVSSSASSSASSSVSTGTGGGGCPRCTGPALWSKAVGGASDEEGNTVAIDPTGNILVGGYFTSPMDVGCGMMLPGGGDTPFLFKLDPAGNCIWSKGFAISQVGTTDQVKSVATDAAGNIFITGTFFGGVDFGGGVMVASGNSDVFIVKLTPSGAFVWGKRYGDLAPQQGKSIAVDQAGNVLVTGDFYSKVDFGGGPMLSGGATDAYVVKLDTNGNFLWNKRFGDAANQTSTSIAVDAAGNAVITGTLNGAADFGGGVLTSAGLGDVFIAKLDSSGNHLWSKRFGDASDQLGTGVATSPTGNVVVTGYLSGGALSFGGANLINQGGNDAFLVQLDPAGNHLWSRLGGGPSNQSGLSVAVDPAGNVGMTGYLAGTADFGGGVLTGLGLADIFIAKYDAAGNHLWSKAFGDSATQFARCIAMDANGDSIITGLMSGPTDFGNGAVGGFGGEDVFLVKLGP